MKYNSIQKCVEITGLHRSTIFKYIQNGILHSTQDEISGEHFVTDEELLILAEKKPRIKEQVNHYIKNRPATN